MPICRPTLTEFTLVHMDASTELGDMDTIRASGPKDFDCMRCFEKSGACGKVILGSMR